MIDETCCLLQPLVRRTWAPTGQTPIQYSWDRRGRLSAISAMPLAPTLRRFGLSFHFYPPNIRFGEVMGFIRMLRRHLRRKFILVVDRYSAHRKAIRLLQKRHRRWLETAWLPSYAPDLNVVALGWNHTKYSDLANFLPEDLHELRHAVIRSRLETRKKSNLIRSSFAHAGLEI